MRQAVFTVQLKHLDTLKKQLEEYRKTRVRELVREWLEKFVSLIAEFARDGYQGAVNVTYHETAPENGDNVAFIVSADGEAVVFLEFGAGYGTDTGHPYAAELTAQTGIAVAPGSYSSTVGAGQFAGTAPGFPGGYWIWGYRVYSGIRPRHALLNAVQLAKSAMETGNNGNNA